MKPFRRPRLPLSTPWLAALAIGLLAQTAAAAPPAESEKEARSQFEKGKAEASLGHFQRARELFLASLAKVSAVGTLLNLADCEEQLGLIASAWQHNRDALSQLPPGDSRTAFAKKRAAALEPRLPRLHVALAKGVPEDTQVLLDARVVAKGADFPVDPGHYVLTVTAKGRVNGSYEVTVVEKETRTLTVEPGPQVAAQSSAPVGSTTVSPSTEPVFTAKPQEGSGSALPKVGYVTGSLGLVGVVLGGVMGGLAVGRKNDLVKLCPDPSTCSPAGLQVAQDGKLLGTVSTIGLVAGGAFLATGIVLVIVGRAKPATEIRAGFTPQGAGVTLRGSF